MLSVNFGCDAANSLNSVPTDIFIYIVNLFKFYKTKKANNRAFDLIHLTYIKVLMIIHLSKIQFWANVP